MGLGDLGILEDGDGGGDGGGKVVPVAASCSICLEAVMDSGDRSRAKLQCGHQFHLDCIGSAFNIKGVMQCPNCRKIEKGQWLYANGSRPLYGFNMDDWVHDDDLSYSEMSFGVHWCPFSGLTRLPTSFDEGEFASSAYHDLLGHHAIFSDHTPVSSSAHPCPYIASASNGSVSNGSSFNNHWSGPSVPSEVPNSYAFPSMDGHYQSWDHFSPFGANSHVGAADQPSIPSVYQRAARHTSDVPRPGMHPFVVTHSSASRAPSSVISPYLGAVARNHDRAPSLQAYFQQSNSNPAARTPLGRRSGGYRGGLAQAAPISSSSDQSSGFYFFSSSSSGRSSFQEPQSTQHQDRFHFIPIDRDSIWGPFHTPAGGPETGIRSSGFQQRYGSERMPPNRP